MLCDLLSGEAGTAVRTEGEDTHRMAQRQLCGLEAVKGVDVEQPFLSTAKFKSGLKMFSAVMPFKPFRGGVENVDFEIACWFPFDLSPGSSRGFPPVW